MRASKTILLILHRGFNKIKQDGKVMVLDQQSAEKLYNRLRLVETDEGTYKIAFENESGTYKDILSPGNRWLEPNTNLRIFGKKFVKDMGFDVDRPRTGTKSKILKKKMKQIEMYVDEIDDNKKQFAKKLNELPMTSEGNQDNIMLQDIITKNEIATDNSIKLIESDEGTYKIAFENEIGTYRDLLSPGNRWLESNAYLRIFGKKFIKDMGFDVDKPESGTKSKIPEKRMEQMNST